MVVTETASPAMEVLAEFHVPGLDLSQRRWTYHTVFMSEMRSHLCDVGAQAQRGYEAHGRGVMFIDATLWSRLVRRPFDADSGEVGVPYLSAGQAMERLKVGTLASGVAGLVQAYDPGRQFLLVVEHQPVPLVSCYLIQASAAPSEAEERERTEVQAHTR